ncbi:MAG: hypothetical protein C4520_13760 [Candidatus Abyssobacteria bacterium SURF_5]|uniref:Uncharacterized protein n=1 Tax=Abyssobacteria bacterium (strain SURF_5) TaxID=2093360 RepID=A0A3A4NL22_ABYX5|nr:MAG: hypothetical protein C4520_13760 [Candidatus Abyssubacteria bacterium SURF_5]
MAVFTVAINLPFGFLRSKAEKFSLRWFLYIHIPVPLIFLLRRAFLVKPAVVPLLVAAAVAGQLWGGRLNRDNSRRD